MLSILFAYSINCDVPPGLLLLVRTALGLSSGTFDRLYFRCLRRLDSDRLADLINEVLQDRHKTSRDTFTPIGLLLA